MVSTTVDDRRGALKHWLRARLTQGSRPREEWRDLWAASWDQLVSMPVRQLIDPDAIRVLAERLADLEFASELSRPILANTARVIVAELQNAEQPIDRLLPSEARERLERALGRPGLVDPDWVHAVFRGEAAEAVINDALYRALKDFSRLLPRLIIKLSPMGRFGVLGSAGAFAERMMDELEKLIEPEIKAFLAESTGRVLERAGEFTIARLDDETSIEFRVNLIRFMLSKSPAFFMAAVDEELLDDMSAVMNLTARYVSALPETRENLETWIDRALAWVEGKSLGEILELDENHPRPPVDALADVTWPVFSALLVSPHAQTWLDALVDELIDEYERMASNS